MVYEHTFPLRHHWWIDSGIIGLYDIAGQLKDSNSQYHSIYYSVNMQGLIFQAPTQETLKDFLDSCYEELANRYWNVSTRKQRETNDWVIYDKDTDQFRLSPRRNPTPIPDLFKKGTSYRGEREEYEKLSLEMQKRVDTFLQENKKTLWGTKKQLLYDSQVCHPIIKLFPQKGKKTTCCICGQENICSEVSQPSFLLFASSTATLSFNSEGKKPDKICWECELLSKFAVEAAYYKKRIKDGKQENLFILQMTTSHVEKLINSHMFLSAQSTVRQFDEENYLSNIGTIKSDNRLLYYAKLPYEFLWAFFHDSYESLRIEAEKHAQSAEEMTMLCIKPVIETPLQIILLMIGYKGQTFILKEIIAYTETAYAFRLLHSLHDESAQDHKFLFKVFQDLYLLNEGKASDISNNLWRNRILQRVLQKKSILQPIESFAFRKSLKQDFPY